MIPETIISRHGISRVISNVVVLLSYCVRRSQVRDTGFISSLFLQVGLSLFGIHVIVK
jgi:hypothetical protein